MPREMNLDDVRGFVKKAALREGWELNGNEEFLGRILEGLLVNYRRYGYFQCPCRDSWGDRTKDRDIVCPCLYCGPDIEEFGQCFCGLFLSGEMARSGRIPSSIPDRRPEERYP